MTNPTTAEQPFSVCVYCGSRPGADSAYAEAARQTGLLIGQLGWQLVYGGGKVGLMGIVANAVLEAGGRVVGVIPRKLMEREVGHGEEAHWTNSRELDYVPSWPDDRGLGGDL